MRFLFLFLKMFWFESFLSFACVSDQHTHTHTMKIKHFHSYSIHQHLCSQIIKSVLSLDSRYNSHPSKPTCPIIFPLSLSPMATGLVSPWALKSVLIPGAAMVPFPHFGDVCSLPKRTFAHMTFASWTPHLGVFVVVVNVCTYCTCCVVVVRFMEFEDVILYCPPGEPGRPQDQHHMQGCLVDIGNSGKQWIWSPKEDAEIRVKSNWIIHWNFVGCQGWKVWHNSLKFWQTPCLSADRLSSMSD